MEALSWQIFITLKVLFNKGVSLMRPEFSPLTGALWSRMDLLHWQHLEIT